MRCLPALALLFASLLAFGPSLSAQSVLEVSAVKPHPSNAPCPETRVLTGGQVDVGCFSLEWILREGLNLLPSQLSGGGDWVRRERWDITAKHSHPSDKSDEEIYREVLLAVAHERFGVRLQHEKHPAKGFALELVSPGRLGKGLQLSSGQLHSLGLEPGPALSGRGVRMAELAEFLRWPAGGGRVIVDRTGLGGLYDVHLRWTPLRTEQLKDPGVVNDVPVIFTALRDQLGLKLVSAEVQQDIYIIESAKRPGAN